MRTVTVAFRSAKRQVADKMMSASARIVDREFDPGLPQQVFFYYSSDFSSLGVGVDDFADFFANVQVPSVQIPAAPEHQGGFTFKRLRVSP
jgi:hypothetical protein